MSNIRKGANVKKRLFSVLGSICMALSSSGRTCVNATLSLPVPGGWDGSKPYLWNSLPSTSLLLMNDIDVGGLRKVIGGGAGENCKHSPWIGQECLAGDHQTLRTLLPSWKGESWVNPIIWPPAISLANLKIDNSTTANELKVLTQMRVGGDGFIRSDDGKSIYYVSESDVSQGDGHFLLSKVSVCTNDKLPEKARPLSVDLTSSTAACVTKTFQLGQKNLPLRVVMKYNPVKTAATKESDLRPLLNASLLMGSKNTTTNQVGFSEGSNEALSQLKFYNGFVYGFTLAPTKALAKLKGWANREGNQPRGKVDVSGSVPSCVWDLQAMNGAPNDLNSDPSVSRLSWLFENGEILFSSKSGKITWAPANGEAVTCPEPCKVLKDNDITDLSIVKQWIQNQAGVLFHPGVSLGSFELKCVLDAIPENANVKLDTTNQFLHTFDSAGNAISPVKSNKFFRTLRGVFVPSYLQSGGIKLDGLNTEELQQLTNVINASSTIFGGKAVEGTFGRYTASPVKGIANLVFGDTARLTAWPATAYLLYQAAKLGREQVNQVRPQTQPSDDMAENPDTLDDGEAFYYGEGEE